MTKIHKTVTIHPDGLREIMKEVLDDDMGLISKQIRKLRLRNCDGTSDDDSGYNSKVSYYSDEEDSHPRSYVSVHSDDGSAETNATPTEEDIMRMIAELSAVAIETEKENLKGENKKKDDQPVQGQRVIVRGGGESTQATQPTVATSRGGASTQVPEEVTDDDVLKMMQEVNLLADQEIRKSQRQLDVKPLSDEEQSVPSACNTEEILTGPIEGSKSAPPGINASANRDAETADGERKLPTTSTSAYQEPKKFEAISSEKSDDDGQDGRSRSRSPRSGSYRSRSRSYSSRSRSYTPESRRSKDEKGIKVAPEKVPEESAHEGSKPDELGETPLTGRDEVPAARDTLSGKPRESEEKEESKPAGGRQQAAPVAEDALTRQAPSSAGVAMAAKPEAKKVEQAVPSKMTPAERSKAIAAILNDITLTGQEKHEKMKELRPQRTIANRDAKSADGKRKLPTTSTSAYQEPKKLEAIEGRKKEFPKAQISTGKISDDSKVVSPFDFWRGTAGTSDEPKVVSPFDFWRGK